MESVWNAEVKLPEFGRLEGEIRTDVLVIGGGLAGLLCAHRLRQAGVDCVVAEANRICGGTTGHTTAKITSQHGFCYHKLLDRFGEEKARQYYLAQEAAVAEYRALCRDIDCDFEEKNSYVYALTDRDKVDEEMEALARIRAKGAPVMPEKLPFPTVGAIRFQDQAQFNPLKFAGAIAGDLKIFEHSAVRSFDGKVYRTDHGTIRAEKTIVATHFPIWNRHGSYFLKQYQHRSYVLALENGPELDGMYLDESGAGLSFRNSNGILLLGGGSHRTGKQGGGWEALVEAARIYYPGAKIKYRWAAQDCMTLDDMPYIGRYSARTPDLYVATGFGKWGMTSSMVAADILSDLVQGRENPNAPLFSPSRSMLRPQLAANGIEALRNLLTPTRPRCPHMGCALKWNRQEHTWDCPCHGSRFDEKGKLLEGPSMGDLQSEKALGQK